MNKKTKVEKCRSIFQTGADGTRQNTIMSDVVASLGLKKHRVRRIKGVTVIASQWEDMFCINISTQRCESKAWCIKCKRNSIKGFRGKDEKHIKVSIK